MKQTNDAEPGLDNERRRALMTWLASGVGLLAFSRLFRPVQALAAAQDAGGTVMQDGKIEPVVKSDAEWRRLLTPAEYHVLRESGTEQPYTSPLEHEKRPGTYVCAGCGLALFPSRFKFDSGTGWPSFYDVLAGHVATKADYRLIIPRTEYHCARCGGHQGHVFKDGPPPTGLRYCNNGIALRFIADEG
ncbi:MAG TPA: peptide-methionine (R)-S-oxide reductase MsrB [Mariprofundaceae bacterium]|nr:peptide-methionine (R)-S-oxide reductase MsrB [Mariprofundaceae bacterium]